MYFVFIYKWYQEVEIKDCKRHQRLVFFLYMNIM